MHCKKFHSQLGAKNWTKMWRKVRSKKLISSRSNVYRKIFDWVCCRVNRYIVSSKMVFFSRPMCSPCSYRCCLMQRKCVSQQKKMCIFYLILNFCCRNTEQYTSISEGIINLLLLDMKQRSTQAKTERYQCPFGLRSPQHPMIMLLQKKNANTIDLANKMNGICNHRNKL